MGLGLVPRNDRTCLVGTPDTLCCKRLDESLTYFVLACTSQIGKRPATNSTTRAAFAETISTAIDNNNNKAYNDTRKLKERRGGNHQHVVKHQVGKR